jgi:hypothetical protein
MEDALAHLDKIAEDVRLAQEQAIDDQIAAKEELKRIEREAQRISEAYAEQHRKVIEERIRNEILLGITKNMILAGRSTTEIYQWIGTPQKIMADAWMDLGFEPFGKHIAHVGYDQKGREGDVIFYRDDIVIRFPFEFGGGLTLAIVYVPTEETWTSKTSLPLEDRMPILEFTAKRIIRDQAQGYRYVIEPDCIRITLE